MGNKFDRSMQSAQFFDAMTVTPSDSDPMVDSDNGDKPIVSRAVMLVNDDGSPGTLAWKSFSCVDREKEEITIEFPASTDPMDFDGKGFIVYDKANKVGVWMDGSGSTADPAWLEQVQRAIKVDISAATDQDDVATVVAAALDADAQFVSSATTDTVTCTDAEYGARPMAEDLPGPLASGVTIERVTTLPSGVIVPIVTDQILDTGTAADAVIVFY